MRLSPPVVEIVFTEKPLRSHCSRVVEAEMKLVWVFLPPWMKILSLSSTTTAASYRSVAESVFRQRT